MALPIYNADGSQVNALSATYSLFTDAGVTLVDEEDAPPVAGVPTVTLIEMSGALPQHPWRERWTVEIAAQATDVVTFENEVILCRLAPSRHLTLEDLYELHPQWRNQLRGARGARVTEILDIAWRRLVRQLLADGHLPARILNWWALAEPQRYWAAAAVCRDFFTDVSDASKWERLATTYEEMGNTQYEQRTALVLDTDEDGVADTPGQTAPVVPGPPATRWRWGHG